MKMPKVSLLEWQNHYGTERACEKVLVKNCGSPIKIKFLYIRVLGHHPSKIEFVFSYRLI